MAISNLQEKLAGSATRQADADRLFGSYPSRAGVRVTLLGSAGKWGK
jgi:hypothetical protein